MIISRVSAGAGRCSSFFVGFSSLMLWRRKDGRWGSRFHAGCAGPSLTATLSSLAPLGVSQKPCSSGGAFASLG